MDKINQVLTSLILLLVISSCSLLLGGSGHETKNESFETNFKKMGWKKINPDSSDIAFQHLDSKSILIANSFCKKYEGTALNHLTLDLLAGYEAIKITRQLERTQFQRKSLYTEAEAVLDGVKVFLSLEVVQKNRCTYDFIMINPKNNLRENLTTDFEAFVSTSNL